jgi:hypothetical protein
MKEVAMPGSIKTEATPVGLAAMIEQCKSVLRAGGTVYLGETHNQSHARQVCAAALADRSVQYFCIEYDTAAQETTDSTAELIEKIQYLDAATNFRTKRKVADVTVAAVAGLAVGDPDCKIVFMDHTSDHKGRDVVQSVRQNHMKDQIKACRNKITKVGRGVLVLVGSDHLETTTSGKYAWDALHEIVYAGHSFVFGRYETCYMVWQLS